MYRCTLCHFDAPLDDAAVLRADGSCICLRCYGRETETGKRMPKALRRQLIAVLAELEAA
jgi:recombinational DNA repair protein (RecF pathway)